MTRTNMHVNLKPGTLYQTTAVVHGLLEKPRRTKGSNLGPVSFSIEERIPKQAVLLALKTSSCPKKAVQIMKNLFDLVFPTEHGFLCLWKEKVVWVSQHELSQKLKLLQK